MKKIVFGLFIGALLILAGCEKHAKLEDSLNAESVQAEINNTVLSELVNTTHVIAYAADEENASVYILTAEEVNELIDMQKDFYIMEKTSESSKAYDKNIIIEVFKNSASGYDGMYVFSEAGGELFLDKGWNNEGQFVYYKLRSEKLTKWIKMLQKNAEPAINKEAW